jgi:coproporphyrinogen III oxidase-like Fe-S oxidoreductase
MKNEDKENAGVISSQIKFCDLRCEYARFPEKNDIDGSRSCRTYLAIWCTELNAYTTKNAPCAVRFGKRRPKTSW